MGAEKPQLEETITNDKTLISPLLTGVAILFIVLMIFTKVDVTGKNEIPQLSPKEEAKLQKRLKEIDDSEQYALIAKEDGWYQCNHPGRPTFYLHAGEVWKYGTTTKQQFGRYTLAFLEKTKVFYIIQFQGTIAECLKEEQRKMYYYPYLPENLARSEIDRLPRPPYNSKMQ
jgi:hypothetical protein